MNQNTYPISHDLQGFHLNLECWDFEVDISTSDAWMRDVWWQTTTIWTLRVFKSSDSDSFENLVFRVFLEGFLQLLIILQTATVIPVQVRLLWFSRDGRVGVVLVTWHNHPWDTCYCIVTNCCPISIEYDLRNVGREAVKHRVIWGSSPIVSFVEISRILLYSTVVVSHTIARAVVVSTAFSSNDWLVFQHDWTRIVSSKVAFLSHLAPLALTVSLTIVGGWCQTHWLIMIILSDNLGTLVSLKDHHSIQACSWGVVCCESRWWFVSSDSWSCKPRLTHLRIVLGILRVLGLSEGVDGWDLWGIYPTLWLFFLSISLFLTLLSPHSISKTLVFLIKIALFILQIILFLHYPSSSVCRASSTSSESS